MCQPGKTVPITAQKSGAGQAVRTPPAHDDFSKRVCTHFSALDADEDGFISEDEVDAAINDRAYTGDDGAMVATLKRMLDELEEASDDEVGDENDGVTAADVTDYDRRRAKAKSGSDELVELVKETYKTAREKIADAQKQTYRLVPGSNVANRIDPFSVRQAGIGSCYFLAAIVALAYHRPSEVANLITHRSGSGAKATYDVRFPGDDKNRTVRVSAPTDAEIALFSTAHRNGLWLAVLEKAFGTMINADKVFPHKTVVDAADDDPFYEPLYTFEFNLSEGLGLITGRPVNVDELSLTANTTTEQRLRDALLRRKLSNRPNKLVLAGTDRSLVFETAAEKYEPSIRSGHAFAVYKYDEFRRTVSLYDPHGTDCGERGRGHYEIPIDDFCRVFSSVAYEE